MAGDLADPHGTHRVCTEAALEAIEQLKAEGEDWLNETHIWLYRGAWMEWELGRVDMAVPLSPDEVVESATQFSVIFHRRTLFRSLEMTLASSGRELRTAPRIPQDFMMNSVWLNIRLSRCS